MRGCTSEGREEEVTVDRKKLVNLASTMETMEQRTKTNAPVNQSWFRMTNLLQGETDIYIYDEIGMYGVTATNFIWALQEVNTSKVNLHLSSYGGDIKDGIAIYNALLDLNAEVEVYIDSIVASAASFIAMAGDVIKMRKASRMMIHEANGGAMGTAKNLREMADILDSMTDMIAGVYADRAGGTNQEWRARMEGETWFGPQEALQAGLVDEILDTDGEEDTSATGASNTGARMTNEAKPEIGFSLDFNELFTAIKEGMK